jgi:hypothetical protein
METYRSLVPQSENVACSSDDTRHATLGPVCPGEYGDRPPSKGQKQRFIEGTFGETRRGGFNIHGPTPDPSMGRRSCWRTASRRTGGKWAHVTGPLAADFALPNYTHWT